MTIPDPKKFRPGDLSDAELKPLIERFFEDPEDLTEDAEVSEAERIARLRVETKRHIANFNRDMRTAAFIPICTVYGKNPLHDCVKSKTTCKNVKLLFKSQDLKTATLDAILGFAEKPFDDSEDIAEDDIDSTPPLVTLPPRSHEVKVEAEVKLSAKIAPSLSSEVTSIRNERIYHWFTLEVDLPGNVAIVAVELFPNPEKKSIEDLFESECLSKEFSDSRLALFTCRPIDGIANHYELFTRSSSERLFDLNSVLVLRVKEAKL